MQHEKNAAYMWDMLDAAKSVVEFVSNRTYKDFAHNRMMRSAVERQIEIIGEAANSVSKEFQNAHPEIPWKSIIGQRHVLAHEYADIKYELLWKVVTVHIPELIQKLESLIPPLP